MRRLDWKIASAFARSTFESQPIRSSSSQRTALQVFPSARVQGYKVREIVFTLGVVVRHALQKAEHGIGVACHDAGVAKLHIKLLRCRLTRFNDRLQITIARRNQTTVQTRLRGIEAQHADCSVIGETVEQAFDGRCRHKRAVSI